MDLPFRQLCMSVNCNTCLNLSLSLNAPPHTPQKRLRLCSSLPSAGRKNTDRQQRLLRMALDHNGLWINQHIKKQQQASEVGERRVATSEVNVFKLAERESVIVGGFITATFIAFATSGGFHLLCVSRQSSASPPSTASRGKLLLFFPAESELTVV